MEDGQANRSAIPPRIPRCRSPRPARTTPTRSPPGGTPHPRGRARGIRQAAADRTRAERPRRQTAPFTPALRDAILRALYASGSDLLLIPMQDVFGWTDRINTPATVTDDNWTWRLPWPVDTLADQPEASERAGALREWAEETGRIRIRNPEFGVSFR